MVGPEDSPTEEARALASGVRAARPSDASELDRAIGLRAALEAALGVTDDLEIESPRIGRFVLDKKLGRGGMGVVYRARDVELDRVVALKFLHASGRDDERERLIKEARALARLSNPSVVAIHEVGVHDDRVYFAMEYVQGGNLRQWLDAHPDADWRKVIDVFLQAGRGLAAAHEAGIVHRDFKPENVLVGRDGGVRVGDFGLAMMASAAIGSDSAHATMSTLSDMMDPTSVAGTPAYMAPEQLAGKSIGPRTDQYSFCKSLRECLERVAKGPARSRPRWSGRLDRILERGLAPDPERRHPDMRALLTALERFRARGRTAVLAGGAMVGAVALLVATRLGAGSGPDPGQTCREGSGALRAALGDPPLSGLEQAFGANELGPETLAAIRPALEDYAARWADAYVDACDATWRMGAQSTGALDLRLDCLEGRRVHVERLVGALAEADERMIVAAPIAVAEIPSLEPCARPEQLARVAPSVDAGLDVIEEVAAIALELTRLRVDLTLSELETIALAERLVERAQATAHAPTIARAHLLHGHALLDNSHSVHGVFERAFIAAQRGFDDQTAFEASLDLSSMYFDERSDVTGAKFWTDAAEALAHRLQLGSNALGGVELRRGYIALFGMETDAAITAFGRSLELFDARQSSVSRANARSGLAMALDQAGRFDEAIAMHELAVDELVGFTGPRHPVVLTARGNLATALLGAGRLDEARSAYHALLEAHAKRSSGGFTKVSARMNLAEVERRSGRYDEAEEHLRLVIEQLEHGLEGNDRLLTTSYHNLAAVLEHVGRYEEALELARRAVALVRRNTHDEQPHLVAGAQLNEAVMLWRLGEHDEAHRLLDTIIMTWAEASGSDGVELELAYEVRSAVELSSGRHERAVEDAKLGLAVLSARATPNPYTRARLELRRAEGELALGHHEAAREALETARAGFDDDDMEAGWAAFLLARTTWAGGEQTTAVEEARAACKRLRSALNPHDRMWLEACEAWLKTR